MNDRLPAPVAAVCETWLARIDTAAPGLVPGLYLRGGLAFGEWVPGQSDVDFVATLARRPSRDDLQAIATSHVVVHEEHPEVPFDGAHLLASDLTADPELCPDVPCVLHAHFDEETRSDINPVTWHELAHRGITVRGPAIGELGVWTSDERLADFTRGNLDTYWRANAEGLATLPPEGETEWACCWCVLGVARLHHLLVTGEMTTKSGAGRWGLTYYPERFRRVLLEAMRIRAGGPEEYADDAPSRGRDTADFTAYVVAAGT